MTKLTLTYDLIRKELQGKNSSKQTLSFKDQQISSIHADISSTGSTTSSTTPSFNDIIKHLFRLDLSNNILSHPDSLTGLQNCYAISFLNLSHNKFKFFYSYTNHDNKNNVLHHLPHLQVLNLSHNQLQDFFYTNSHPSSMYSSSYDNNNNKTTVHNFKNLKALILNHNNLTKIESQISTFSPELTTLVISHNKLTEISNISQLSTLNKLSAAHNEIRSWPADLSKLPVLKELRLNDNKISFIPDMTTSNNTHTNANTTMVGQANNKSTGIPEELEILDLGNNLISDFPQVTALTGFKKLVNLNLKGNKICQLENYREKILLLVPSLRILDGERFDAKFLERKRKRKVMEIKKFVKEKKSSMHRSQTNNNDIDDSKQLSIDLGEESIPKTKGLSLSDNEKECPVQKKQRIIKAKEESLVNSRNKIKVNSQTRKENVSLTKNPKLGFPTNKNSTNPIFNKKSNNNRSFEKSKQTSSQPVLKNHKKSEIGIRNTTKNNGDDFFLKDEEPTMSSSITRPLLGNPQNIKSTVTSSNPKQETNLESYSKSNSTDNNKTGNPLHLMDFDQDHPLVDLKPKSGIVKVVEVKPKTKKNSMKKTMAFDPNALESSLSVAPVIEGWD